MTPNDDFRCGFVAVVGRPNVGKSTLINALMGAKISIVTAKPQTTRHRILAVQSNAAAQILYIDTPGIHRKASKAMNRVMNRTATSALDDADVILFVIDATSWTSEDDDVLKRIKSSGTPVIALLNKIDKVRPKEKLLDTIALMSARHEFSEIVPVSALQQDNLSSLTDVLPGYLPVSPPLYPDDMRTDRSSEFHAAEIIREKLMLQLHQELPYGLTVQIERFVSDERGIAINAIIWVERDSQKGIVVGKRGSVLKKVGRAARLEIADMLGAAVHLELWVKVKRNWADNEQHLAQLGFDTP